MSWYVERLLIDRDNIRSGLYRNTGIMEDGDFVIESFIDSDVYNDLILVEKTLESLVSSGKITKEEGIVGKAVLKNKLFSKSVDDTGMTRITVSKIFRELCEKIAFCLGDYFTDDGLISRMSEQYNLSDENVELLISYIKSNIRHKVKRGKNA